MRGVNKAIIVGTVGADPEYRAMPSGSGVTTISVATSEEWKDKESGEKQQKTEWHKVVFFNRLAEVVNEYVKKGSKLYIEGSIKTRKYTDKSDIERYTTEIVGATMQMLNSLSDNSGDTDPSSVSRRHSTSTSNAPHHGALGDFDDDIPF